MEVRNLIRIGLLCDNISDKLINYHDSSDKYFLKAKNLSIQLKCENIFARRLLRYTSFIHLYDDKPNIHAIRKIRICFQILKMFLEQKDTISISTAYNNLYFLYSSVGDYEKAIQFSKKRLTILLNSPNLDQTIETLESIGDAFCQQKKYDSSLVYYSSTLIKLQKFEKITSPKDDFIKENRAKVINNLCGVYSEKHLYDSVIFLAKRHAAAFIECSDTIEGQIYEIVRNGRILGSTYRAIKDYNSAISIFINALKRYDKTKDPYKSAWDEVSNLFLELGLTYHENNNYSKAIEQFVNGLSYSRGNYALNLKSELLKALSDSYLKKGDIKTSYDFYRKYSAANDSAIILENKESNIKQAALIGSEFDFKNQIEIEQLENQKQNIIAEEKSHKQKLIIWFTLIGLILLTFVAVFIFRSLLLTRKQKELIELQKAEVDLQKHIIEEKNNDIMDSIRYAKRIQQAQIPNEKQIVSMLKKSKGPKG
jgi:tetratricopeptide (TPR) repeat protein